MTREEFDLMTTIPTDEKGVQLGNEDYTENARIEAQVLMKQIKTELGKCPERSYFSISEHAHEFGTYLTLCYNYDSENDDHLEYIEELEDRLPREWSDESVKILKEEGY